MSNQLEFCILKNDEELKEHETLLFKAFSGKKPGWLLKNYKLINRGRLQAKIPYTDQSIYAVKLDGKIVLAIAFNMNCNRLLQVEDIGFSLSAEEKREKFCEVLYYYATKELLGEDFMSNIMKLGMKFENDFKILNIKKIFGSCSDEPILITMYELFGFKIIKKLDKENELLLSYDIAS